MKVLTVLVFVAGVMDEGANSPRAQFAQQIARRAALDKRCDEVDVYMSVCLCACLVSVCVYMCLCLSVCLSACPVSVCVYTRLCLSVSLLA